MIISAAVAKKLQQAVFQFQNEVPAPEFGNWKEKSDAELWRAVLIQIAVVGKAKAGEDLYGELAADLDDWYRQLLMASGEARLKAIHKRLRNASVRYVTLESKECRKSKAAVYNFELIQSYGGPKRYFSQIAEVPVEAWRVSIVSDEMEFIRNKGARDMLNGLGIVRDAIAFDSRLQKVLSHMGAVLPNDLAMNRRKYKALQEELIDKVCVPCGISGGHLDQILFLKANVIVSKRR